jgi:hypothetical protein
MGSIEEKQSGPRSIDVNTKIEWEVGKVNVINEEKEIKRLCWEKYLACN